MSKRRDHRGRLNMAVRKEHHFGGTNLMSLEQEHASLSNYTADWVNRVELPEKAHSTRSVGNVEPNQQQQRRVALSAPAMSIRSKASKSSLARNMLELELKHMKEQQKLDRETRELEREMKEQEIEKLCKLKELEEKRRLQELEIRLAKVQLEEQLGIDGEDSDLGSNRGEEVMDELVEGQIEQGMALASVHGNEIQDQEVRDGFPERKASNQPRSPSTLPNPQRRHA